MLRRRFALLVVALAMSAATAGACSGDETADGSGLDASSEGASLGAGICPFAAPQPGENCLLPEGTTCAFGACGTPIAECTRGVWRYGGSPATRPPCPAPEAPPSDSPCPPCWPADVTCLYGSCSGPDASTNMAVASCPHGSWVLQFSSCLPADAGADVQGDVGAEAD